MARRRRGRWRPLPRRAEPSPRSYLRLVDRYTDELSAYVMAALRRAAARGRQDASSADDWPDVDLEPEDVHDALQSLAVELALTIEPEPPTQADIVKQTGPAQRKATAGQRRQLTRVGAPPSVLVTRLGLQGAEELFGVDLRLSPGEQQLVTLWAAEGAGYIRTAGRSLVAGLPDIVREAAERGRRWETIADAVEHQLKVTRTHARFIARDQTAQLNGRITQHLQQKAGVTEYVWRSSHDGRVRDTHASADGNRYAWASAGAPGVGFYGEPAHPGQAGNCRCTAEPVVPDAW